MPAHANRTSGSPDAGEAGAASAYLGFVLGDEAYAVDMKTVREIRAFTTATRVPGAPDHMRGLMDLDGAIVPVMDLRRCFGLEVSKLTPFTVLLVLQTQARIVAVAVDDVTGTLSLEPQELRPAPELAALPGAAHIRHVAAVDGRMLMVLGLEGLVLAPALAAPEVSTRRESP